ncbi:MAG: hypothetical protein AAB250_14425, partial [Bdellovibrionota bacterium]
RRAAFFSGVQIWFGMYVFVFQFIVLAIVALVSRKRLMEIVRWKDLGAALACYIGPAAPILVLYVLNHFEPDLVSPYENPMSRRLSSLHWYHFWNVLPGNLLYSSATNVYTAEADASLWYSLRKTCFPGVVLPFVALLGVLWSFKGTKVFLAIFFVFLALAFGTNLFALEGIAEIPFGTYFRVASRAYLFSLLAGFVYFAVGTDFLTEQVRRRWGRVAAGVPVVIGLAFVVENVPFPLPSYDYATTLEPVESYRKFFEKFEERKIVADLPSDYQARLPQSDSLWTYSRDALYMNWQAYHRQIIVGGINSYLPRSRISVDGMIQRLPAPEAIAGLKEFGVEFLVFHKKFILFPNEDVLSGLKASSAAKLEFEDGDLAIFSI